MSDDGSDADASRMSLLKRIAEVLEVSTRTFYEPERIAADGPDAALDDDVRAMLTAFVRIRDPERRRACLAYVRAIVSGEEGTAVD